LCLYFQMSLKPNCKYYLSNAKQNLLLENPSMIIVPGSTVKIGDISLTIGERNGSKLSKITIVQPDSKRQVTTFYGRDGELEIESEKNIYHLHLRDVKTRIVEYLDTGEVKVRTAHKASASFPLNVGKLINNKKLRKRAKYLDFNGLVGRVQVMGEQGEKKEVNELLFQLNQGIVLALSPFAFLMVAMPFGFRSARSETSIGLVISLLVVIVYFTIVLLMKNFEKYSYAHLLIWLPNILFVSYGIYALKKITKT
jgi:lipopolysaccharide export system permease protein